jgi:hypothetical protein
MKDIQGIDIVVGQTVAFVRKSRWSSERRELLRGRVVRLTPQRLEVEVEYCDDEPRAFLTRPELSVVLAT